MRSSRDGEELLPVHSHLPRGRDAHRFAAMIRVLLAQAEPADARKILWHNPAGSPGPILGARER